MEDKIQDKPEKQAIGGADLYSPVSDGATA